MDVISPLTSPEEDEDISDEILSAVNYPTKGLMEIDPLLGSVVSLFPSVGKAASLIHKFQQLERSSLSLVSQDYDVQMQL